MGMRVGGSSATLAMQSNAVSNWQQRQQNFKSLASSLQSGDLAGAQQAFAAIAANNPNINGNSPLGQIGKALQAGDISGAQQVAQSWRGNHHANEGHQSIGAIGSLSASPLGNTILQSLSPSGTGTSSASASGSSTSTGSTATSPDQVSQALSDFMQTLIAALQAQNTAKGSPASAAPASQAAPTAASSAASATSAAPISGSQVQGHHHHHHHSEGAGQISSELNSLITQLSSASTPASGTSAADTSASVAGAAASASTPASSLQQSYQNLLSSVGAGGSGASLNNFLQTLSANLQGTGSSGNLVNSHA